MASAPLGIKRLSECFGGPSFGSLENTAKGQRGGGGGG